MKFYLAILLVIMAVAVADKDDDFLWKSYKVYFESLQQRIQFVIPNIHSTFNN